MSTPTRLAIVASHPVQYYAPWFRRLAADPALSVRVFYLWEAGAAARHDPGFGRAVQWDLDLLSGYEHEFVPNTASRPGTAHFHGLVNPTLASRLRAARPDAILVYGYGWRSLARLALTWRDCPLILRGDSHLLGRDAVPTVRRRLQRWLTSHLLKRYRAFAAVGAAHRRFLVAHGVPEARIFPVPHCVDNERWSASAQTAAAGAAEFRARLGIPPDHRVILFAGKLEAKKRPDLLVDAFRRAALPDTALLLVGDGPLRDSLQAQTHGLSSVHWAPFQNQLEMPRVFAAADLLVLPSEGPGETWGLVVNEAMASGLPCLVSTHVGCREDLILEDSTGWSFPAGDPAALASQLRRALAALRARPAEFRAAVTQHVDRYSYACATAGLHAALAALFPRRR